MAAASLRTPEPWESIGTRMSIHEERLGDMKGQIQIANQTQRALRLQQQSGSQPDASTPGGRPLLRKTWTLPYPHRPGHFNDAPVCDPMPLPLHRATSFNSLSTVHREAEAAALSLYRSSPISAISPPSIRSMAPSSRSRPEYEPIDTCPPCPQWSVETLRQQREYHKLLKKSLKKKEKEKAKAQKDDAALRRALWASEIADSRKRDALAGGETLPIRSKSTRSARIASHVVKTFSLRRPLSKLGRSTKRDPPPPSPPTLDDFDSKEEIRGYLHPETAMSLPSAPLPEPMAELPAELPRYTPFEDSTRTEDNQPALLVENVPPTRGTPEDSEVRAKGVEFSRNPLPAKSMRCDSCQSPIRLKQIYYHCSICEDGDRILCSSCTQSGFSCRHEITENVRHASRVPSRARPPRDRKRPGNHQSASAVWGPGEPEFLGDHSQNESSSEVLVSAINPWVAAGTNEAKPVLGNRHQAPASPVNSGTEEGLQQQLRQREETLALREKEVVLRERESSLREQQAALREQEAALYTKQHLFALQLQATKAKKMEEASMGIGMQFHDVALTAHVRTHANKRKADTGTQARAPPPSSRGFNQGQSPKRASSNDQSSDEEDDQKAGSPKKIKQESEVGGMRERLFACPFCKHDKARYSEQNNVEKHYRGCSSGFWPDISRLKQHLYRVHWRGIHCGRCYVKFPTTDLLGQHVRNPDACLVAECPFPEKFDDKQHTEIRRRRPTNTPEQVWYTMYQVLFPGAQVPESPYVEYVDDEKPPPPRSEPEEQDMMNLVRETFKSQLERCAHIPGANQELVLQQLDAAIKEVLQNLRPVDNQQTADPAVATSPQSENTENAENAANLSRADSISLTPISSMPASPSGRHGPPDSFGSQFLLPTHRLSFSRPFSTRVLHKDVAHVLQDTTTTPESATGSLFPTPRHVDAENDQYDEDSHSWSHGDELGLAITTDLSFDFPSPLTTEQFNAMLSTGSPPPPASSSVAPVNLSGDGVPPAEPTPSTTGLKPKHSIVSSRDSGYGSLKTMSSSASSTQRRPARPKPKMRSREGAGRGRLGGEQQDKESNPGPDSQINFEALFREFLHADPSWDSDTSENVGAQQLSAYLDSRYSIDRPTEADGDVEASNTIS